MKVLLLIAILAACSSVTSLFAGVNLSDFDAFSADASRQATWTANSAPNRAGDGIRKGSWDVGADDARWLGKTKSGAAPYHAADSARLGAVESHLGYDLNWSSSHPNYVANRTSGRIWDNGFLFQSETGPGEQYLAFRITFDTDHQAQEFYRELAPTAHSLFTFTGYNTLGDTGFAQTGSLVNTVADVSDPNRSSLSWFVHYNSASILNGVFFDDDPFLNDNESWGVTCFNGIASFEIASVVMPVPEPSHIVAGISLLILGLYILRAARQRQRTQA
jgi:hypothetical protein